MELIGFPGDTQACKAMAVFCFAGSEPVPVLGGASLKAHSHFGAKGKKGELFRYPLEGEVRDLFLVGLGEEKKASPSVFRNAVASLVRKVGRLGIDEISLVLPQSPDYALSSAVAEGAVMGDYRFDRYRKPREDESHTPLKKICLWGGVASGLERGRILGEAQIKARDLANRPGNDVTPDVLAQEALRIAKCGGMECRVLDEIEIQEESMGGLWHVGKGSQNPPRFIHMTYRPEGQAKKRIALVGKGITFDSGGLSLKSAKGIRTMKGDKTGACNVLAIMEALPVLKPDVEVHGIVGAAENMPDGKAYRPDDIVTARNGKTIEIVSTDAEGRVTLADSLSFASDLGVDVIIDMATLTGAIATALGNYTAGLLSDHDGLSQEIIEAGALAGERYHRFAMDDEKLREQIDSPAADLLNSGGPGGGSITAGMFLREFVKPSIPWAHLDIAGVDFYDKEFDCYGKGATAFGVRTCLEFILRN